MSPDSSGGTPQSALADFHKNAPSFGAWLAGLIACGFGLRLALIFGAESSLDCDESTVALMSLDILEQGARPMFFYGGAYNGGGALEAYLGAVTIALGASPALGLKCVVALLWLSAATLFANLCQRSLPRTQALMAVLFLVIGTPFFLEWSVKARGGFSETLLFSVILLWLAHPPPVLKPQPTLQCILFGLTSGLALWASEMIVPMIPFAALWLLLGISPAKRLRAFTILLITGAIATLPLVAYNFSHDWEHLRQSALGSLITANSNPPLELPAIGLSLRFVLGPATWLLVTGALLGAVRILARKRDLELGHVLLAHGIVYLFAYWVSGLRFLDIPPSRVLYPLQLNLAVLLAWAVCWNPGFRRWLSTAAVACWLLWVLAPTTDWMRSEVPRDHKSWRASWCHIDGDSLRTALLARNIDAAYMSYWTGTPVLLANRMAVRDNPAATTVLVSTNAEDKRQASRDVAFVLHESSPTLKQVEAALQQASVAHQRSDLGGLVILSEIDRESFNALKNLPVNWSDRAWPPLSDPGDGFN